MIRGRCWDKGNIRMGDDACTYAQKYDDGNKEYCITCINPEAVVAHCPTKEHPWPNGRVLPTRILHSVAAGKWASDALDLVVDVGEGSRGNSLWSQHFELA